MLKSVDVLIVPLEEARDGMRLAVTVFARILAVADLYDRLTADKNGQRRSNIEILHLMRTQYNQWLDPVIVAALPSVVPPFPPGVKVRLADGTDAVTMGFKVDRPYQPIVKRISSAEGAFKVEGDAIDLSRDGSPQITRVAGISIEGMVPPPPARTRRAAAALSAI